MRKRLKLLSDWQDKMPRTNYWFMQGLEGGAVAIGAALGIALEHWWPSKYLIVAVVVSAVLGIGMIIGTFWWASSQLLKEKK